MSTTKCFGYRVDGDTAANCLAIIERAAQRVRAGKSPVVAEISTSAKARAGQLLRYGRNPGYRSTHLRLSPAVVDRVIELSVAGCTLKSIAAQLGLKVPQVCYIRRREHWRMDQRRTQRRAA